MLNDEKTEERKVVSIGIHSKKFSHVVGGDGEGLCTIRICQHGLDTGLDVPFVSILDLVEDFHIVEPFTGCILSCIEDGKDGLEDVLTEGRRIFSRPVEFMITFRKVIIPRQLFIDGSRGGEIFKKLLHVYW